jgi:DNA-directed RNA polymerase subunit RPC12/RpoP
MEEQNTARKASYAQCVSCGAVMMFDPKTNSLKCEYCNSFKPLDKSRFSSRKEYKESTEIGFEKWGEVKHFRCATCGAVSVLPDYEMSPECPFCNSGNLICESEMQGLAPTGVLPFKIDKKDAESKYGVFIKKKWFAPSKLRKNFKVNAMKGIYIPTFSFTTDTYSNYTGVMGKYYYVTVGSGKNRRTVRKIRYFPVAGGIGKSFEDLQYEVSSHIVQNDLQKLGYFDVQNALEFDKNYFAGFSSERYTESLDTTWDKASSDMHERIKSDIKSKHNADVVQSLSLDTSYNNRRYQYLLAPIWKCAYKYKDRLYNFFINARNGQTTGKAPVSPIKVSVLVIAILSVIALIAYFFVTN